MALHLPIEVNQSYDVFIEKDILHHPEKLIPQLKIAGRPLIISDTQVAPLYTKNIQSALAAELLLMPNGETHKTRETKAQIEDQMQANGYGRDTTIIAVGGGVVTDMAGFIAATYCRGIPVIYIPTTLLAMVDAAVGGKTGVNTPLGKNLIGAFKQPTQVIIDPDTLQTLKPTEMTNGLIEAIKHGLIRNPDLYQKTTSHADDIIHHRHDKMEQLIFDSIDVKREIVIKDTFEIGLRQVLNLGHTVGHALEQAHQYQLPHGHAVAHGIIIEAHVAKLMGHLSSADFNTIKQDIQSLPLQPLNCSILCIDDLIHSMRLDKKAMQQQIFCVLLNSIGQVINKDNQYSFPVDPAIMKTALTNYLNIETPSC